MAKIGDIGTIDAHHHPKDGLDYSGEWRVADVEQWGLYELLHIDQMDVDPTDRTKPHHWGGIYASQFTVTKPSTETS